jgi:hypothetical protein
VPIVLRRRGVRSTRVAPVEETSGGLPGDGLDLAVRQSDGAEVSLFWSRSSGRTWIEVRDIVTGFRLVLETLPEKALEAYYDSYAYFVST